MLCEWPICDEPGTKIFMFRQPGYNRFCADHAEMIRDHPYDLLFEYCRQLAFAADDDRDCQSEVEAIIKYVHDHDREAT